jgi:hypothetical protein
LQGRADHARLPRAALGPERLGVVPMTTMIELEADTFVNRRNYDHGGTSPGRERRQFSNSHEGLSPEAKELALAVDQYKLAHRRRFITYEEMLSVLKNIGYRKSL